MKKMIATLLAGFSFQALAAGFMPFLTQEEAEKNCPSNQALTFKANAHLNPAGFIEGANSNNIFFKSLQVVMRPAKINENGYIADINLRETNGMFGYNSNDTITCFYKYTAYNNQQVYLNLRSIR